MLPLEIGIYTNSIRAYAHSRAKNTSNICGFTLVELLVVIFIIGISLSLAYISFGDFGKTRQVKYTAEEMKNIIELYRDQAVLESTHYTIITSIHGFTIFKNDSQNTTITKKITLPRDIILSPALTIEILASRYMTPFTIFLGLNSNKQIVKLVGKADGSLNIEK